MLSEEIVVIEDDPRIVRSLEMMLPEYEMVHFSNGKDALEYLVKPNLINLVLLDVMLPGMNGLSVLKQIKEANKDIAVIMMTAFGSMDVAIQALRYH
ncbi:MAG: response regulator, partial [Candidatus Omnitrophica bacterium]|nr:response regulator [Candidatus Omnitrophota bacterium]